MERETGIEPATSSLGSWRSTAELLPLINYLRSLDFARDLARGLRRPLNGSTWEAGVLPLNYSRSRQNDFRQGGSHYASDERSAIRGWAEFFEVERTRN